MLHSQAGVTALVVICFMTFNYAAQKAKEAVLNGGSLSRHMTAIGIMAVIMPCTLLYHYTRDVPDSLQLVAATIAGKDLDPAHETAEDFVDVTPTIIPDGDSFVLSPIIGTHSEPVHVPARFSLLLTWAWGQAWVPVNGVTWRKLDVGNTVTLQLRQTQDVTLFTKSDPEVVAGPIVSLDGPSNPP